MTKRDLILNTMQELFQEGVAGTASVNDIAKRAGIAKGGLYYYFRNKEEVLDALVEREYETIITHCNEVIQHNSGNALDKLALLLYTYTHSYVDPSLNEALHLPQNAAIHQKSLAYILTSLSELVTDIINQGIEEGLFICDYPKEYSEIMLSVFTFLMDPGIFVWTKEQSLNKLKALAAIMETGLGCSPGCFSFFYQ